MTSGFRPAEEVAHRAAAVLERERGRLARLAPEAELLLTGASSLPGALTSGDIDLHLRVPAEAFSSVVAEMQSSYNVVHPHIWSATLATFAVRGEPLTGIAVTPIASVHDRRFVRSWQRLRADPAALAAYNTLKAAHRSPDDPAYKTAKSSFFDSLTPDDPA